MKESLIQPIDSPVFTSVFVTATKSQKRKGINSNKKWTKRVHKGHMDEQESDWKGHDV